MKKIKDEKDWLGPCPDHIANMSPLTPAEQSDARRARLRSQLSDRILAVAALSDLRSMFGRVDTILGFARELPPDDVASLVRRFMDDVYPRVESLFNSVCDLLHDQSESSLNASMSSPSSDH